MGANYYCDICKDDIKPPEMVEQVVCYGVELDLESCTPCALQISNYIDTLIALEPDRSTVQ
jgi:hypothetical protein